MSVFQLIKAYCAKAQREDLPVSYLQQDTISPERDPGNLAGNALGYIKL